MSFAPESSPSPAPAVALAPRNLGPSFEIGQARLRLRLALGFFLIASVPGIAGGWQRMAWCSATAFATLFVHELGHALTAMLYGGRARIVLHVLGAHTEIEPRLSRQPEIVTGLMGPVASLSVGALLAAVRVAIPGHAWLTIALWANVAWGVVNLLPILPFDGGRVLLAFVGERRRASALLVSGAFSAVLAVEGLAVVHSAALTFVFGAAAIASMVNWAKARRDEVEQRLGLPQKLVEARRLLAADEPEAARRLALQIGQSARRSETANAAWDVAAWAQLALDRPEDAYRALQRIAPASTIDSYLLAAIEAARGQPARAIAVLEAEQARGQLGVEATKLLIELHARLGNFRAACQIASARIVALTPADVRRVIEVAFEWNAFASATQLAQKLFTITSSPSDAVSQAYGLANMGDNKGARRILSDVVTLLSRAEVDEKSLARLRELASRPDSSAVMDPQLSQLVVARAS